MEFQRLRGTETNLFIALHGCARRGCAAALIEVLLRYLCAVVEPAEAFESCLTSGNITVGTGDALRLYLNDEVFSRGDMAIRWIRRFYRLSRQSRLGVEHFVWG